MKIPGHRIEKKIGQGGMAEVYLGVQESFDRKVAIKILTPKTIADQEFAARFLLEAKTVAQMSHSNIISVYDFGSQDDYYYMSMEYLSGGTLSGLLKGGLELEEALKIMEEIASALNFAHGKNIIHRDVKPENVMFREDHTAVLMDFGIAKRQDVSDGITVAGAVLGTPKYMSPEQITGKDLDGRCDIYALGIMFYEMLTGKVPYESEDYMAVAMMHVRNPIPKLPIKFSKAQHFLERLMAKNPEERFSSGDEVVKATKQLRESGEYQSNTRVNSQGLKGASVGAAGSIVRGKVVQQQKSSVKQGMWTDEIVTKKGLLSNKYQFSCRMVSEDYSRFSVAFGTLTDKILDWYQKRKGGCESIVLDISVPAGDEQKVRSAIRGLSKRGKNFNFLKKIPVSVKMTFIDTLETRSFKIKPEK